MKKNILISLGIILSLCLMGCSKEAKESTINCSLTSNNTASGYSLKSTYTIYAKKGEVEKVVTQEVVTSESSTILSAFETTLNQTYSKTNETYGGYTYKVTINGNTLTADTTIDYNKMNLAKYVEDNSSLKPYVNDNNMLTVDGLKTLYKSLGATCE